MAGNLWQLVSPETYGTFEYDWQKKYGPLYRFKSALGQDRLMVGDPAALQFLTSEPTVIGLPSNRKVGKVVFGERTFWVLEAEEHRRARAALNPGFSGAVVRQLRPLFSDIASRIVQQWAKTCSASDSPVLINVVDL
uniref:Cytochrome P450 n=1 Tax=Mycena chlorophos TaxID=658473 RepID=A0ABQ0M0V4_MYCCL|nr:cytochrome P450 [Mycena chlorophos]